MCGRYALYGPVSRPNRDTIEFLGHELEFAPTWNAAPSQALPVLRSAAAGGRELTLLRWGLVPGWAKDPAIGSRLINARGETVAVKPAFRAAFARRRCLVPMSGYYEWQRDGTRKIPHFISLLNADVFAVAGLHERWEGREAAGPLETFTIITTEANAATRRIHDRMPVILHESDYDEWLAAEGSDVAGLARLLVPFPDEELRARPVSQRVNNVRNNDAGLIAATV